MALQWFLRAATTQIVGHPSDDGCSKEAKAVRLKTVGYPAEYTGKSSVSGKSQSSSSELGFQMPLHYPRYNKEDYENMEEWRVDVLLKQYGLTFNGSLEEKRAYAMGAFLWPHQL